MKSLEIGMSEFRATVMRNKYAHDLGGRRERWPEIASRTARSVLGAVNASPDLISEVTELIDLGVFVPGGRYLAASGRPFHQIANCFLFRAEDSREGWADLQWRSTMALMTGGGIGVDYSDLRERGAVIRRTGGYSTGPTALMQMVNDGGRGIRQGGDRRSAIWAGLRWSHPDIFEFMHLKDWSPEIRAIKERDFNFPAPLDGTNISISLDDEFFQAYRDPNHPRHALAHRVYWEAVELMRRTGEPGFSVDVGENAGETLRNACTELTSRDDSDICNIGSINLSKIESVQQMRRAVEVGTIFLLAGTVYGDVPFERVRRVREKNRRLGLGLMGIHEWLLRRGKQYGPDLDLKQLLCIYETSTEVAARQADLWGISRPVKTRAIAPNGTIGIVAGTTTGIEPIFCAAYKRRYLVGQTWKHQYVLDPTARQIIVETGCDPDSVEDAYVLAGDPARRLDMQAWVQQYVDHGISSTLNLPPWGSGQNGPDQVRGFGETLIRYLPRLRGVTCYPDGSRGGQPLVRVPYREAAVLEGVERVEEAADVCSITNRGSCGS